MGLKEKFDEWFDEIVNVGDLPFLASDIYKELDPIAYEEEFNNWIDSFVEDVKEDLEYYKENEPEILEELEEYGYEFDDEEEEE